MIEDIEVTEVLGDIKCVRKSKVKTSKIKQITPYSGIEENFKACTEIILFDGVCFLVLESLEEIKEMIYNKCDK